MEQEKLVRPGLWAESKRIPIIKNQLRTKVPKLKGFDIGKRQFPKNIIYYLYESGFQKSGKFLENIFEPTNEEEASVTQSILSSLRELIHHVVDTLKDVESGEASVYDIVTLAILLSKKSKESKWLARHLFEYAVDLTSQIRNDNGLRETKARYAYGDFLLSQDDFKHAIEVLDIAYDLAAGKNWYSPTPERTLFRDINYLLFLCYSRYTEKMRTASITFAISLSLKAVSHAIEAQNKFASSKAYLACGTAIMESGDYENAIVNFNECIQYAQIAENTEDLCDALLKKAVCANKMGRNFTAIKCISLAKHKAIQNTLPLYMAKSRMVMGDIEMAMAQYNEACASYTEAFQELSTTNMYELVTKARCFSGFALAHAIFEPFTKLIARTSGVVRDDSIKTLVLWKGTRTPFWVVKDKVYEVVEGKHGFYDEYRVDGLVLQEGKAVFMSQMQRPSFLFKNLEQIPFSKRILEFYSKIEQKIFLYL